VASGGQYVDETNVIELNRDPQMMRRQSYRFWRLHPHGRNILRNFVRFIIGREFGLDFADEQHGTWNDDHTKLQLSNDDKDPLAVRELWDDFAERNSFRKPKNSSCGPIVTAKRSSVASPKTVA
jgi:hypothetical protein